MRLVCVSAARFVLQVPVSPLSCPSPHHAAYETMAGIHQPSQPSDVARSIATCDVAAAAGSALPTPATPAVAAASGGGDNADARNDADPAPRAPQSRADFSADNELDSPGTAMNMAMMSDIDAMAGVGVLDDVSPVTIAASPGGSLPIAIVSPLDNASPTDDTADPAAAERLLDEDN